MAIDYQKLMKLADLVETIDPAEFQMTTIWDDEGYDCLGRPTCGSVGCMLGHGASSGLLRARGPWRDWKEELGLSRRAMGFLFEHCDMRHASRTCEMPQKAAARVRKFVYWKLRNSELNADDNSRYLGDVGVAQEVLEMV